MSGTISRDGGPAFDAPKRPSSQIAWALVGLLSLSPWASVQADHDQHSGHHGNTADSRRDHNRGHDRERHAYHRYPVYAPPPVYYPRHESPGISLFFPFEIR